MAGGLRSNPHRKIETAMLRISYKLTDSTQQWILCGQLAGPWVEELRACWSHGRLTEAGAKSVVDLSEVTFIDENGEKLLSEMRSAGVGFVATGVDNKHLLDNLEGRDERALRRLVGRLGNVEKGTTKGETK
jgi:hypothetical protein